MAHDVFISYPHQDKTVADAACTKLETQGIRCWIAPRDIAPGADWAESIVDAIDRCRVMIIIFSAHTNQSKQVGREVQQAFDGEKPVVPLRIEDVTPKGSFRYYMGSVHWLDALTPPLEEHLERLLVSVRALVKSTPSDADDLSEEIRRDALARRQSEGQPPPAAGERRTPEEAEQSRQKETNARHRVEEDATQRTAEEEEGKRETKAERPPAEAERPREEAAVERHAEQDEARREEQQREADEKRRQEAAEDERARVAEARERAEAVERSRREAEEERRRNQPTKAAESFEARPGTPDGVSIDVGSPGRTERRVFLPGAGRNEWFKDFDFGPEMVIVPAGSFMMGSPESEQGRRENEGPQHFVSFEKPFAVGRCAVTFAQWDAYVLDGGTTYKPKNMFGPRGTVPVINVSPKDASQYLAWLSNRTGKSYRLLSEAEWEYVARAGTTTPYWMGGVVTAAEATFRASSWRNLLFRRPVSVESYEPNAWGLYQVHGNVGEWVSDAYHASYEGAPTTGSAWLEGGLANRAVCRGGACIDSAQDLRSAARSAMFPERYEHVGFRVARTLA